ncbi:MAG TPA: hypothetical protein VM285_12115, partial [Polyangia bacterium]|nr:hypothetical protein [Polyangia bacterium]
MARRTQFPSNAPTRRGIAIPTVLVLGLALADCSKPSDLAPGAPASASTPDEVLDALPTGVDLEISNILYSGDIAAVEDLGRVTRFHHQQIVAAIETQCRALDLAYDDLFAANERLVPAVVAIQAALRSLAPGADWVATGDDQGRELL